MVAVRTTARGLSTSDLEKIKDALGAGRRPKVIFTEAAGQIAGQSGQIVRLTDPELGEEWVVVRFGQDELPFSPADLVMPPRGAPGRRPAKAPETAGAPLPPATVSIQPGAVVPVAPEERTMTGSPMSTVDSAGDAPPPAAGPATEPAVKAPARRAAKPKPPPALTVTLSYTDGEWSVTAQQGVKALARPCTIRASEALRMVALLDVPGVQTAVEEIVAAAREQAESAAQRLRAELAEIEAQLAELRDTP